MGEIVKRVIITREFVCEYCGDRTVNYYKGLLLFGRWILPFCQMPESDVPNEFKVGG